MCNVRFFSYPDGFAERVARFRTLQGTIENSEKIVR